VLFELVKGLVTGKPPKIADVRDLGREELGGAR
jgi:hypothetical protein